VRTGHTILITTRWYCELQKAKKNMRDYEETRKYWDAFFADYRISDPMKPISNEDIELALRWLCDRSKSVIEFGCAAGRSLFRCLALGVEKVTGIDISPNAVSVANKVVIASGLQTRCKFLCGDVSSLLDISEKFDSGILFNIVDNISPTDGVMVLEQFHKILKPHGKLLMKLNDYVSPDALTSEQGYRLVSGDFYKEKSGLYFWNLTGRSVEAMVSEHYTLERYDRIELEEFKQFNRLYYLRSR
jgi:SAM-dependent methyltransferase